MIARKYSFTSLDSDSCISIHMGDDSQISSKGKGAIHFEHSSFQNVLYVPSLASKPLSVYQMTHTGFPKKVVFNPNDVDIFEITIENFIAVGKANHAAKTYEFSNFVSYSNSSSHMNHGNEVIRIWYERFGHLNYKYLQCIQNNFMVEFLSKIKSLKWICKGCIIDKYLEHKFD